MKTIGNRIREIKDFYYGTQRGSNAKFAEFMGESPQVVSNWFGRHDGIGDSVINKILTAFPEIDKGWLLGGNGSMFIQANGATEYHFDKPVQQECAEPNNIPAYKKEAEPLNLNAVIHVPLVNQYAYAGYLNGYQNETYMNNLPTIPFIADHEARGHYVAFEVKGDSMNDGTEDSYLEGDRLLCREVPQHLWADSRLHIKKWDFVIVHSEGILVKRIINHDVANHTITVHSLNEFYPDRTLDLADVKQIFNVVEMQRPRRR